MKTNPRATEHLDTPTMSSNQDATVKYCSIFNHNPIGVKNSGEVIYESKAKKFVCKHLTTAEIVTVLSTWKKQ
jgi:hypothetical protein